MTWSALQREVRKQLLPTEGEDAAFLAKELLCSASGMDAAALLAEGMREAPEACIEQVLRNTERLINGEPLAHILGEWDFRGLTFRVTPDTLIPREDTNAVTDLAAEAAKLRHGQGTVLDICTGTGCIGISLKHEFPNLSVTLADLSPAALAVAKENIRRLCPEGGIDAVTLDLLAPPPAALQEKIDILVSNPPYITKTEMEELTDSVRLHEPEMALYGGEDGLSFYRALIQNWKSVLKPGGCLCMEFGMGQHTAIAALLEEKNFTDIKQKEDYNGIIRAISARKKMEEDDDGI